MKCKLTENDKFSIVINYNGSSYTDKHQITGISVLNGPNYYTKQTKAILSFTGNDADYVAMCISMKSINCILEFQLNGTILKAKDFSDLESYFKAIYVLTYNFITNRLVDTFDKE